MLVFRKAVNTTNSFIDLVLAYSNISPECVENKMDEEYHGFKNVSNMDQTRNFNHNPRDFSAITRSRANLMAENALLRHQLIVLNRQIKRSRLTNPDRSLLVFLSHFT